MAVIGVVGFAAILLVCVFNEKRAIRMAHRLIAFMADDVIHGECDTLVDK
jgi:hypothetical protein